MIMKDIPFAMYEEGEKCHKRLESHLRVANAIAMGALVVTNVLWFLVWKM